MKRENCLKSNIAGLKYHIIAVFLVFLFFAFPFNDSLEKSVFNVKSYLYHKARSDEKPLYSNIAIVEIDDEYMQKVNGSISLKDSAAIIAKADSSRAKACVLLFQPDEVKSAGNDKETFIESMSHIPVIISYYFIQDLNATCGRYIISPDQEITRKAEAKGFITQNEDNISSTYNTKIGAKVHEKSYYSVELAAAAYLMNIPQSKISLSKNMGVYLDRKLIPTDSNYRAICIPQEQGKFETIKMSEFLNAKSPLSLKDKLLVIGFSDRTDPAKQASRPYEVASVTQAIMRGQYVTEFPVWINFLITLGLALLISSVIPYVKNSKIIIITAAGAVIYTLANIAIFIAGINIPLVSVLLTFVTLPIIVSFERYRNAMMLSTHFVPIKLIETLQDGNPEGGMQIIVRKVAVLFSDIKGYTTFSERTNPADIMLTLNEYLKEMNQIIEKNNGVVLNYQGDSIMAIFGLDGCTAKEATYRAIKSAMSMQDALNDMRRKWQMEYRELFVIGVGISSGEVAIGALGSDSFRQYTAIGDTVNLAARLQTLGKDLRIPVLIDENSYNLIKNVIKASPIRQVYLKGKFHSCQIFQVEGYKNKKPLTNAGIKAGDNVETALIKKINFYREVKESLNEM